MKARLVLTVILLLAAVTISSWFLYKDDIRKVISPDALQTPDYTLDNFTFNNYTKLGQLDSRIKGIYLEHFPNSSLFRIKQLHFSALQDNHLSWEASANNAKLHEITQVLDLSGLVQILYYTEGEATPIRMRTESMTIYPKHHYAESSQPSFFNFAQGSFESMGGFKIDGKDHTLRMFGGVKGEIEHE